MWRQHSWEMVACEMKEEWSPEKGRLRETGLLFSSLKGTTVCRRVSAVPYQHCGWRVRFTATTHAQQTRGHQRRPEAGFVRLAGSPVEELQKSRNCICSWSRGHLAGDPSFIPALMINQKRKEV